MDVDMDMDRKNNHGMGWDGIALSFLPSFPLMESSARYNSPSPSPCPPHPLPFPPPWLPSYAPPPRKHLILCSASSTHQPPRHVHGSEDKHGAAPPAAAAQGAGKKNSCAPLVDALSASASYPELASFHFPGHRRGSGAPHMLFDLLGQAAFAHDLPELPELDNLFNPQGVIAEAQEMAAHLFGSDSSYFLVNGSTCGIQAAVMATCGGVQARTLILPRNSHICAISGMVLSGAQPTYMMPSYDPHWDIAYGIRPHDLCQILENLTQGTTKTDIGAVLITSPTYHGVCSDVNGIAKICHSYGVPLIVDEAHGAHFCFHENLPQSALQQGADIVVQSTHKVLTSLTQSAMLHVQGNRVNKHLLVKCLQSLQSSSPSYLLLASLDASRQQVSEHGRAGFSRALEHAKVARDGLSQIEGLKVLDLNGINIDGQVHATAMDPLRITVGVWELGLSGFEVDDKLRLEHNVVAELPSLRSITFAISLGTTSQDVASLLLAFRSIARNRSGESQSKFPMCSSIFQLSPLPLSKEGLIPREAFFSLSERVDTRLAYGRVCCELICPYPPGIPVLVPGDRITQGAIDYIRAVLDQGGFISGASDGSMETVLVMCG